jgi:photosystem I reaction center subunit XII
MKLIGQITVALFIALVAAYFALRWFFAGLPF